MWRVPMKMARMGGRSVSMISCNPSRYGLVDLISPSRRLTHHIAPRQHPHPVVRARVSCVRAMMRAARSIDRKQLGDVVPLCRVHHELSLFGEARGKPEVEDPHPAVRPICGRTTLRPRARLFSFSFRPLALVLRHRPRRLTLRLPPCTTPISDVRACGVCGVRVLCKVGVYGEGRRRGRGEGGACSLSHR